MTDLATLGLEVDSASLDKGTEKLKDFSDSAKEAAKSADDFNAKATDSVNKTGQAYTSNAERITAATAQQTGALGMMQGAVSSVSAETLGLITVMAGAAATIGVAAAAIAYHWSGAQEQITQALIGIGAKTSETVQSLNAFSVANATATGLSIGQARDVAIEFTKVSGVSVGSLKGLGDAVLGYSVLTGETATKATQGLAKAFSGDLKGAMDIAANTYGVMNGAIRDEVQALLLAGDKTAAAQVIINAMAEDNKKAADSVGILTKAWDALGNAMSFVANLPAHFQAPPLPQQIAAKQADLASLQGGNVTLGSDMQSLGGIGDQAAAIAKTKAELEALQTALNKVNAEAAVKQLNAMAEEANAVVKAVIPQIAQIDTLRLKLTQLQAAQNTPGVQQGSAGAADQAAVVAIQNQIAKLQEAQGQAERYNERVQEISSSWGNVGQSTALSLQAMENALPVAEAWTNAGKMLAQYQATVNDLLDKGKTLEEASALAEKQYELSKAAAVASAEKLVQASQDNLDKIHAQGTGMEGVVASSIAYRDAIMAGATATQAAAISANVLQANMLQAAQAAGAAQQAEDKLVSDASAAALAKGPTDPFAPAQMPSGALTFAAPTGKINVTGADMGGMTGPIDLGPNRDLLTILAQQQTTGMDFNAAFSSGGIAGAINAIKSSPNTTGLSDDMAKVFGGVFGHGDIYQSILGKETSTTDSKISTFDTLRQLQNAQTQDKSVQAANIQAELAWLQTLPETIARDQKIAELMNSINSLTGATNANTAALASLNPLYSQGHGALAIGYYHAASGLDMIASGPSTGDQVPFHAMVNGGERIRIGPPGNDNSSGPPAVYNTFNIGKVSTDNSRRFGRQITQGFAQSIAATR